MRVVRWIAGPAAVAVVTLLYTFGPVARVRTWFVPLADDATVGDDPLILAIYAAVALAAGCVLATGDRWRRVPLPVVAAAGAVTAWHLLSALWSGDPGSTVRHGAFIAAALVVGAGIAVAVSLRVLVWGMWAGVQAGLFWSFVAIRSGANGLDHNGDYAGVYFNRNSLALFAALGILLSIVVLADLVALQRPDPAGDGRMPARALTLGVIAAVVGLAGGGYLLIGAGAATPMVALAVALVAAVAAVLARRVVARGVATRSVVVSGGATLIVLGVIGWLGRGGLFDLLGRRSDLTGRADAWDVAIDWAGRRPLQGYGYFGAWSDDQFVSEVREASEHVLTSAHNGFVEAYLGGGVIGLVLFTALIAIVFSCVAATAVSNRSVIAVAPFAIFMFVLVENLAETLIVANHLAVVLLAATAVAAARGATSTESLAPSAGDAAVTPNALRRVERLSP